MSRDIHVRLFIGAAVSVLSLGLGLGVAAASTKLDAVPPLIVVLLALNIFAVGISISRAELVFIVPGIWLVVSHIIGWTLSSPQVALGMGVLATGGILATWAYRRPRLSSEPLRTSTAVRLGVLPGVPAILGALLAAEWNATAMRVAITAFLLAIVVALTRAAGNRAAWGLTTGVHIGLIYLLAASLARPLDLDRFSGSEIATIHPNIVGMFAWTLFAAWMALPGLTALERTPGIATALGLLSLTDSRTSTAATVLVVVVVVAAAVSGSAARTSRARRIISLSVVAAVGLSLVLIVAGSFFLRERVENTAVLTGREEIWATALTDFGSGTRFEQLAGVASAGASARITSEKLDPTQRYDADNGFVSLLRRSGVVGLLIGFAGLLGLLRVALNTVGRRESVFAAAVIVAALATIPVESWLFGGSLWVWVACALRSAEDQAVSTQITWSSRLRR